MTADEALAFLERHQPMAPTRQASQADIDSYHWTLKLFQQQPDPRSVPLLLNSFGEGDLHGVYVLVEDVIAQFDSQLVLPHLKKALSSPYSSVRYWCAQIAASFPSQDLLPELYRIARNTDDGLRWSAAYALSQVEGESVTRFLSEMLEVEQDEELRNLLGEMLEDRS